MKEISIVQNKVFGHDWVVLRERLGDHLCKWYSMAKPQQKKENVIDTLELTTFPKYAEKISYIVSGWGLIPKYYTWWAKQWATDLVVSSKIANDDSKIVFCLAAHTNTIKKCIKKGKTVVAILYNIIFKNINIRINTFIIY